MRVIGWTLVVGGRTWGLMTVMTARTLPLDPSWRTSLTLTVVGSTLEVQGQDVHLLRRFLLSCERSLERTKKTIDLFFTVRAQAPEFFDHRDPLSDRIQNMFRTMDMVPLPKMTTDKDKLFIYRISDPDPDKFFYNDYIKMGLMIGDVRMMIEEEIPEGDIGILDMAQSTLRHLTRVNMQSARKYMFYVQEAHPVRLKQIHVINISPFADKAMALAKPFIKPEVAAMIHFHVPGSDTLFDFIPRELLPSDYGGNLPSMLELKAEWKAKVEAHRDMFLQQHRWQANESRRAISQKPLFSTEGSFRSLSID